MPNEPGTDPKTGKDQQPPADKDASTSARQPRASIDIEDLSGAPSKRPPLAISGVNDQISETQTHVDSITPTGAGGWLKWVIAGLFIGVLIWGLNDIGAIKLSSLNPFAGITAAKKEKPKTDKHISTSRTTVDPKDTKPAPATAPAETPPPNTEMAGGLAGAPVSIRNVPNCAYSFMVENGDTVVPLLGFTGTGCPGDIKYPPVVSDGRSKMFELERGGRLQVAFGTANRGTMEAQQLPVFYVQ